MTFEEKINKFLDQADEFKASGNMTGAIERYRKVADMYFAAGEKSSDVNLVEKYLKYGRAFARAAQIIEENI